MLDVSRAPTSVFVRSGIVAVSRHGSREAVELRSGGVDVDAASRAPAVKRWPAECVARLLARFGG